MSRLTWAGVTIGIVIVIVRAAAAQVTIQSEPVVVTGQVTLGGVTRLAPPQSATVGAQEPSGVRSAVLITQERATVVVRPTINTPIVVVDRLLSFDADADARIARAELPERMQVLLDRGDKNQDGFLDSDEIRAVIAAPPPFEGGRISARTQSSAGLAGVISDLRLPPEKHDKALAIAARAPAIPRNVNDASAVDVHARMRELLDDEEYENFVAATTRLSRGGNPTPRIVVNQSIVVRPASSQR